VNVEFLNFVLMFFTAFLLLRKPEKERLAFRLLVASVLLMVALFLIATRTAFLPGVNY
jgi:hypothetical protein